MELVGLPYHVLLPARLLQPVDSADDGPYGRGDDGGGSDGDGGGGDVDSTRGKDMRDDSHNDVRNNDDDSARHFVSAPGIKGTVAFPNVQAYAPQGMSRSSLDK